MSPHFIIMELERERLIEREMLVMEHHMRVMSDEIKSIKSNIEFLVNMEHHMGGIENGNNYK